MTPLDPLAVELRGTNLIEASAGTGKTFTITTLYIRLLLELQLPVADILVLTYTNAATAELRARIRRRLHDALAAFEAPDECTDETLARLVQARAVAGTSAADRRRLTTALRSFDEAAIFTIHGFCQRMLQDHAFESGVPFDTQLVTDQTPLQDEVLYDFWSRELSAAPELFVRHLQNRRVTLDALRTLAYVAMAHPHVPVVPEAPAIDRSGAALQAKLDDWEMAHARAAAIWDADRSAVLDCLTSGVLKGTVYRPETIRSRWAPRMTLELTARVPGISTRFAEFAKFTTNQVGLHTRKQSTPPTHRFFAACAALLEAESALEADLDARALDLRLRLMGNARDELRHRKERSHTQSFDDLLHRLRDALGGAGGDTLARQIRVRFRAALIDEFQDTDPVQYEILRRVYHGSDALLFLIGDPKQAIYAFRGADVFTYIAAKADAREREHTLQTNWRSDPRLLDAINTLFGRARLPFLLDGIPFRSMAAAPNAGDALGGTATGRAPLQILFVPRQGTQPVTKASMTQTLPQAIAGEIVHLMTSGVLVRDRPVGAGDMAVLCRTNDQARAVQQALREQRVPAVFQGDASVFETSEALDIERVLRAIAAPDDWRAARAALSTALMGLDAAHLWDLRDNERAWDEWVERLQRWHAAWRGDGFMPAFRCMLDEHRVQQRLLAFVDGERRLTNTLHLAELLHAAAGEAHRGPLALVEWLHLMRTDAAARGDLVGDAAQMRLESDSRAVQLLTIHTSKGLEYPIVFCPYLWDGKLLRGNDRHLVRYHDPQAENRLTLDILPAQGDGPRHREQAEWEALAESLRLLYVALTRARHLCYVVWGRFSDSERSPLGYLLHQPAEGAAGDKLEQCTAERIKGLTDAALRADLDALAGAAGGTIEIRDLSFAPAASYEPEAAAEQALSCRETSRRVACVWRAASFSALVAGQSEPSTPAADGSDYDESAAEAAAAAGDVAVPALRPASATVPLPAFPGGTRTGQVLHEIFEHHDFQREDRESLENLVAQRLARYGVDPQWNEPIVSTVDNTLDTPLDDGLTLRQVSMDRRRNELEFTFPIASAWEPQGLDAAGSGLLTAARLAAVFARHAGPPVPADYPQRLRCLDIAPLAGYLRGFIDLVFVHDGRWYVVDYKSNRLGSVAADYAPERLGRAMGHGHYYLQYHLYVVALHRYLAMRLQGYDYDRHFGGVFYLFVRGMSPRHPQGCGVFRDRPSRALIEGLSAVLDAPGGGA